MRLLGPSQRGLLSFSQMHSEKKWSQNGASEEPFRLKHRSLREAVNFCMQKFLVIGRIGIFLVGLLNSHKRPPKG